jgi:serine/threonine-protein kinase HipA
MMPSLLLEENGRAHFLTKRFDREGSEIKHHVQTFCAMNHFDFNEMNSFSYEQLFQTMRELRLTYAEAEQMFRRMVFNVLARNCDDHTKNFAFRLQQGGKWELAPAYDICHAYAPNHQWVSQHALSINGKHTAITRKDLLIVGESIRCKNAAQIIDHIQDLVQQWPAYAKAVGVSPKLRDAIYSTFELHY